jgi:hypothetical protein
LPESDAGELAFVVSAAVGPVEALEAGNGQAGDAQQRGVGLGVRRPGQHHSIVEDNRAQSQCSSCEPRVWLKRAPVLIVHDGPDAGDWAAATC